MKKKKYQSEPLMVIHQFMGDLYQIGAISAERMREFDEMCLSPDVPKVHISTGAGGRSPVTPAYAHPKA